MTPDFHTLPEFSPGYRWVGTTAMNEEQYRLEGWHLVKGYWVARLQGLQAYGRLIHDRREARFAEARARREADDAWSAEVERMVERTP